MKKVSCTAKKVLDILTADLKEPGDHKKFDAHDYATKKQGVMAVDAEHVGNFLEHPIFSVCHYYEQNGDLMQDPEMTFMKVREDYYPMSFTQSNLGIYQEALWEEPIGKLQIKDRLQAELASFANTWMKNIKDQQEL